MEIARRSFRKYATLTKHCRMSEPEWLDIDIVIDIHAEQLACLAELTAFAIGA